MPDLDPYKLAEQDARRRIIKAWHRLVDFGKTYFSAALLKTLGVTIAAAVAAALNLPVIAFALVVIAFLALSVYAVYATKLLKDQDRELRWAWISGKRVQQRELEMKIALETATLALMGERQIGGRLRMASPELRSALAFHQHQLRLAEERAEAAEAVKEGTATDPQRRRLKSFQRDRDPAPPKGPAIKPIKARREALEAERAALEAEIKSLSTAEDIAAAMRSEEVEGARRTKRERRDAAREADQAARDRVRAGRSPTAPEAEHVLSVQVSANGERSVGRGQPQPTPEQIAKGETGA
ncbi:MAG TPA: hypothetical protein VFN85_03430 [Solirubrobacterales bacterium]|nr:hypothetical protein [Solirubrobacterales bacterium]